MSRNRGSSPQPCGAGSGRLHPPGASTAREILSDVPFLDVLRRAAGPRSCYLVGGAVRDGILGRPCTDFDFRLPAAPTVARTIARQLGGTLVVLHEAHETSRVVVRCARGRLDLDFAAPRRPGLLADLRARDFTLNALAVGPLGGRPRLFDPCGGREDMAGRWVRMTGREALAQDPVRVLRAYRFVATLGFRLERGTRRCCRALASRLCESAADRLGAELLLALAAPACEAAVRQMAEDGVLAALIPTFARTVGIEQGGVHEFDVGEHSILAAARLADVLRRPEAFFPDHADRIAGYVADGPTRAGLVLATLLHDLGKPDRRTWGGRRWRFFGHEELGAELAGRAVSQLRLPRRVRRQVKALVGAHMRLLPFMQSDDPTPRARRRLMRDMAPHGVGAVLLALADRRALRSEPRFDDDGAALRRLSALLASGEGDPISRRQDLPVNGDDLVSLGLTPGPQFRELLQAIEELWVEGRLAGRREALAWLRRQVGASDPEPGVAGGPGGPTREGERL